MEAISEKIRYSLSYRIRDTAQSGVQNVEVSLIDGKVEVTPKEDGQIDLARLLKATL